ncbi:hypothetical protein V8C86DRAFT_2496934, partial [Haematococcus lacustris]
KRALLASLLLGLMVRECFTRVTVLADGQEVFEELPAEDAPIPDFAERNLLGPALLWWLCWPCTRTSATSSTLYLAIRTTATPWTTWVRSWRPALPTASPSCSSAELGKRWLWLEPGSSPAHTSTSAALGCPWMAGQPGLSVSAAG